MSLSKHVVELVNNNLGKKIEIRESSSACTMFPRYPKNIAVIISVDANTLTVHNDDEVTYINADWIRGISFPVSFIENPANFKEDCIGSIVIG